MCCLEVRQYALAPVMARLRSEDAPNKDRLKQKFHFAASILGLFGH